MEIHSHPKRAANIGVRNVKELKRVKFPAKRNKIIHMSKHILPSIPTFSDSMDNKT